MRTANPVLTSDTFQKPARYGELGELEQTRKAAGTMTIQGVTFKTLWLVLGCALAAFASWGYFKGALAAGNTAPFYLAMIGSVVGGLIAAFALMKKPGAGFILAPLFALGEGVFVAAISVFIVHRFMTPADPAAPADYGIIIQAVGLTFAIAVAMLAGYASGVLRLGGTGRKIVIVATVGVGLFYLVAFVVNSIAGPVIPRPDWSTSPLGIGISVVLVGLASLNLVLDFELIDEQIKRGAPKTYEWLGAFGIMVTLVWLYVETLRLLAKLRSE